MCFLLTRHTIVFNVIITALLTSAAAQRFSTSSDCAVSLVILASVVNELLSTVTGRVATFGRLRILNAVEGVDNDYGVVGRFRSAADFLSGTDTYVDFFKR